ncbi:MAG: hypothetical protein PUK49_00770, partial [Oscillospiraceae bacterium]|nr:hypothetical protein [Oscillospiraceae bacterium]
ADINQVVRHKSLICAAENPVLQDFQPITALRAVIEYALYNEKIGGTRKGTAEYDIQIKLLRQCERR